MSNNQLQSTPITGYYEYLSRIRHRVNVASYEGADRDETMTPTTTTTSPSVATVMNNGNTASAANSSFVDNSPQQSLSVNDKDVTKWTSTEVQHWVDEQCQKFELKKATTEKFQMNGQALVLLTKHDFLRRSSDGGEILYYALQRLINPNKTNSGRVGQSFTRNKSSRQNPRIVELGSESDEHNSVADSPSSAKPIVEEPDDPPLDREPESETIHDNHQYQHYPRSFLYNNSHIHQPSFTIPTAAYYHQHQAFPNAFVYAHHHPHHVHPHIHQQQFFHPHPHPHFIHQYQPMMAAQGILIELIDNEEATNLTANGVSSPPPNETPTNGASSDIQEQLYLVTINGQRYVMNEEQTRHVAMEAYQQQQQHLQQQQQHLQQQQQHFHQQQQQQYAYQQQQPSQDNIFYAS